MMIAFVFNGLCPFGLRILAGMGLAAHYTPLYLVFWYLAGAVAMLAIFSRAPVKPARSDMLVGAGLGLFSTCGQTSMGLALSKGIPGNVVFPWPSPADCFCDPAAVTVLKSAWDRQGAGISLGILSIALLSLT
jgi:hypothetical protein